MIQRDLIQLYYFVSYFGRVKFRVHSYSYSKKSFVVLYHVNMKTKDLVEYEYECARNFTRPHIFFF